MSCKRSVGGGASSMGPGIRQGSILLLPEDVVAQIKSSTVIVSLTGVVLELLKNSLDAGATKVEALVDFGRGGCSVEDDGLGIAPLEFREEGSLGKLYCTSKYFSQNTTLGRNGTFLASLAAMSLLTITSRHHEHRSHNSITFHHSKTIERQLPALQQQEVKYEKHGTRVTVRNLFGNLPVRVKQRAAIVEQKAEHDRLRDVLKREVVGLLLSWRKPVALKIRDPAHNTVLNFSGLPTDSEKLHNSTSGRHRSEELQFLLTVLTQTNYVSIDDWQSWVPASASTMSISIKGAISLEPAPTRRTQFISLGIRPLSADAGHNELYDEVNRMFNLSSFGQVEDSADEEKSRRQIDRRFKSDGYTAKQLRGRKGVDRYPRFHLRISLKAKAQSRAPEDQLLDEDTNLQAVMEVLRAMTTQWLSVHHFRPQNRPLNRPDTTLTTTSDDERSQAPIPQLQSPKCTTPKVSSHSFHRDNTKNRKRKIPAPTTDVNTKRIQPQSFINWSRIKSGKSRLDDSLWAYKKTGSMHNNNIACPDEQDHLHSPTESSATPIMPGSSNAPIWKNTFSGVVDVTSEVDPCQNTGDDTIEGRDPVTNQPIYLNARTGCVVPPSPLIKKVDTSHTGLEQNRNDWQESVRVSQTPKEMVNINTPWLDELLKNWNNPVFQLTEKSIHQCAFDEGDIDTGCRSRSEPLLCSPFYIEKLFNGATASGSNKLTKEGLQNAHVIAQLDKKFILIKIPKWKQSERSTDTDALVLIDQHAADERIRVESLLTELCAHIPDVYVHAQYQSELGHKSKVTFTILEKPSQFSITSEERNLFITHAARFAAWGILYNVSTPNRLAMGSSNDGSGALLLSVTTLPPAIAERCKMDPKVLITCLRSTVWKYAEEPHLHSVSQDERSEYNRSPQWFRQLSSCPQALVDLVNSRACRSAIMFNDELNAEQCNDLLERLSKCVFPFMCAHGRPSMVPLISLGGKPPVSPILEKGMRVKVDECHEDGFIDAWKKWRQK